MRNDYHKLLCEHPRGGGKLHNYRLNRRRDRQKDMEDLPGHESMRRPYGYDRKEFGDYLTPLRRCLRSNVGRPWNDVYSELCASLRGSHMNSDHLRLHIKFEVHTNDVTMKDGVPHYFLGGDLVELLDSFYVNPDTGILCAARRARRWRPAVKKEKDTLPPFQTGVFSYYTYESNQWVEYTSWWSKDVIITSAHKTRYVNNVKYALVPLKRRICGKREVKRLGLTKEAA